MPVTMDDLKVEDHLIAFSYRIKPLKIAFTKLFDAGLHVFTSLWPGAEIPRSPIALADVLENAGMRLTEWRFSAGRARADETLSYILGWYETIDFDKLQTCRTASKFVSEEEWVERRKKLANFFTERADLHTFIPNLPFMAAPPAEDDKAEEEGEEEGEEASDAEADDDEDEEAEAAGAAKSAALTETPARGSGTNTETEAPSA